MSVPKHGQAAFGEAVKVALFSLYSSKLRSFLTLLGIILATATLIAVMGVIHGMDVYIAQQVSDMGASGFRIRRIGILGQVEPKRLLELLKKNPEISREEYEFLRSNARFTVQATDHGLAWKLFRGDMRTEWNGVNLSCNSCCFHC